MAVNTVLLVRRRSSPLSAFVFAGTSEKERETEKEETKETKRERESQGRTAAT